MLFRSRSGRVGEKVGEDLEGSWGACPRLGFEWVSPAWSSAAGALVWRLIQSRPSCPPTAFVAGDSFAGGDSRTCHCAGLGRQLRLLDVRGQRLLWSATRRRSSTANTPSQRDDLRFCLPRLRVLASLW